MADGMTVVEQRPVSLFRGVFFHHQFFHGTAAQNHFFQHIHILFTDFVHLINQPGIKFGILNQSMLHHLSKTGKKLAVLQGAQRVHIHIYQPGHLESPHHIFIPVKVHACLAADTAVALGQ